jgi:hypothetical protein
VRFSTALPRGETELLLELNQASLLDAIKTQDLLDSDSQALVYTREQLAEAALEVVRNGFAALDLRKIEIKGNIALLGRSMLF